MQKIEETVKLFAISLILDGSLDVGILNCARTSSSDYGAWWSVDLGLVYGIKSVTITSSLGE